MNNRARYTRQNVITHSFYQLQKFLFDAEFADLSNDARVLYALLRNRHEISIKNEWYDDNDEVFLYFKREEMQNILRLSENTIAKAMKDLKGYQLIEDVRQGFAKPNKIYLLSATVPPLGIEAPEPITAKFEVMDETQENQQSRKNCGSRTSKFTVHEPQNLRVNENHNKKIHNEYNPVLSSQSDPDGQDGTEYNTLESYIALIEDNISYSDFQLARPHDIKLLDEFIAVILDALLSKCDTITVGGERKPRTLVRHNLMQLTYEDMEHVVDQFKSVTEPIKRKRQYMLTMLYNCRMEREAHVTNLFESNNHEP